MQHAPGNSNDTAKAWRKRLMEACATATTDELSAFVANHAADEAIYAVRGPETGLVMVRGRIGGGGSPFNLGEATMSRATIRLTGGEIGHGQCLGTNRQHARLAAIVDALGQKPELEAATASLVGMIEKRVAAEDARSAAQTAATRVDFFTMVRGED